MTELLAIVSIVSGAAVAITVPFINARLERSRLEQQSRDARVEELRDHGVLRGDRSLHGRGSSIRRCRRPAATTAPGH
jgi:hypothetical protein